MEKQIVIILLGPPGSGKGTQAKRITKNLHLPHISTGDLFRENISKHTTLGEKAQTYMNAGKLVPDQLVLDMLFDRVARDDCAAGYLLDGFPRTLPQAMAYDQMLPQSAEVHVINLPASDEIIVKRISGRLTCVQCGHVHNRYFSPPDEDGNCQKCGSELIQRPDDKPEVVKERLQVYKDQTAPLVEYYQRKNMLTTIDGEQGADAVYSKIIEEVLSKR